MSEYKLKILNPKVNDNPCNNSKEFSDYKDQKSSRMNMDRAKNDEAKNLSTSGNNSETVNGKNQAITTHKLSDSEIDNKDCVKGSDTNSNSDSKETLPTEKKKVASNEGNPSTLNDTECCVSTLAGNFLRAIEKVFKQHTILF